MINQVTNECTYGYLTRLTGRCESRIKVVARELGFKPVYRKRQRIFSVDEANQIVSFFNEIDAQRNRETTARGVMTISEISAQTGMTCGQISVRIKCLNIKPVGRIRAAGGTWYIHIYDMNDLPRIASGALPPRPPRPPRPVIKQPPDLLSIKELADRTRSSLPEVCAAIKALSLPAVQIPSHEHKSMLVDRYRFQHIGSIRAAVQRIRESAGTPVFTRRAPEEED